MKDLQKEHGKRLAKAIESASQWYTVRSILGYWWAIFYILLGAREAGKSYSVMRFFLKEYFNKGKEFTWLRLTEASTKKLLNNNAMQFIDIGLMNEFGINSTDITVKGNQVFYKHKKMAKILALSTFYSDKGVALFEDKDLEDEMFAYNICCDEFQRERNEKNTFDITYAFVNQLENLVRHKTNCRIFLIGNTVEECSDILTLFNFIPERFGRYKLKKKRCVIDYIPPSKKYLERRKGSIASLLTPDASTFTNEQKYDRGRIFKGRVYKPQYIIEFRNNKFTVWDKNIILRYNKENKPTVAMTPLLINNTVFRSELRDEVILMNYERKYYFRDMLTQKLFDKCIKEIKGIKG